LTATLKVLKKALRGANKVMEEKVIRRLNRLKKTGVVRDYAIGGAHAVAYYLEPVKTLDLDIFLFVESDKDFYIFRTYFKKAGFKFGAPCGH